MNSKNILTALILIVVLVIIGAIWYVGTRFNDETEEELSGNGEQVTLEGTYICLPHADASGPQTLECAIGLEANSENYALNTSALEPAVLSDFTTGERVSATGMLVRRSELNENNPLLRYDISGVLFVTSLLGSSGETSTSTAAEHVMAGGELRFGVPEGFGLAVTDEQLLVGAVIPPCTEGFDYCIYYNDDTYAATNFESAGVRLDRREDLVNEDACLTTLPEGHTGISPTTSSTSIYALSRFSPIADAAAGHVSEGMLYRLAFDSSCYEFETRIGVSQFENFEPGTIAEFTEVDRRAMEDALHSILESIQFAGNDEEILFP